MKNNKEKNTQVFASVALVVILALFVFSLMKFSSIDSRLTDLNDRVRRMEKNELLKDSKTYDDTSEFYESEDVVRKVKTSLGTFTVSFKDDSSLSFKYPIELGEIDFANLGDSVLECGEEATGFNSYVLEFDNVDLILGINVCGKGMGPLPEGAVDSSIFITGLSGQEYEIPKIEYADGSVAFFWGSLPDQELKFPLINVYSAIADSNSELLESQIIEIFESVVIK